MNFKRFLNPSNWTKLNQTENQENDDYRRDVLFSQILIMGTIISILHFVNDLINANPAAYVIDLVFIFLLIVLYILNERGAHRLAKFLDLAMLNFLIFLLAAILDEKIRMSYNFFPLAILAFLIFYKSEIVLSILFAAFSMILLIVLELTDYRPFGDILIKQGVDNVTLIINILGSYVLVVMGLIFLVKLNLKAENELKIKEEDLQKTNKELDRFVYSASHDLKSPLSSVKGLTNLMKYKVEDTEVLEYVDKINHRILDMDQFIGEIIDYSRNARIEVKKEEINLSELIDEIYDKLKYMSDNSPPILKKKFTEGIIFTDPSRLNVILSNIISNSIKYADPDKSEKWIEVDLQIEGQHNIISIKDNGVGISEEYIDHVFEMFYRANDQSDGSGLGLYIVHEMVEKLQGKIQLMSKEGAGTTIELKIPR